MLILSGYGRERRINTSEVRGTVESFPVMKLRSQGWEQGCAHSRWQELTRGRAGATPSHHLPGWCMFPGTVHGSMKCLSWRPMLSNSFSFLMSSLQGCDLFCRRGQIPSKGALLERAMGMKFKLTVPLVSIVPFRTERSLNGDYTRMSLRRGITRV